MFFLLVKFQFFVKSFFKLHAEFINVTADAGDPADISEWVE